jgi:hypothetical protein
VAVIDAESLDESRKGGEEEEADAGAECRRSSVRDPAWEPQNGGTDPVGDQWGSRVGTEAHSVENGPIIITDVSLLPPEVVEAMTGYISKDPRSSWWAESCKHAHSYVRTKSCLPCGVTSAGWRCEKGGSDYVRSSSTRSAEPVSKMQLVRRAVGTAGSATAVASNRETVSPL